MAMLKVRVGGRPTLFSSTLKRLYLGICRPVLESWQDFKAFPGNGIALYSTGEECVLR